jgi:hypothetical protein
VSEENSHRNQRQIWVHGPWKDTQDLNYHYRDIQKTVTQHIILTLHEDTGVK